MKPAAGKDKDKAKKPVADKAAEKAPAAKKAKRKGGGGDPMASVKKFFTEHVEKLVLGLVALLSALLLFRGFRAEGMKESPDTVRTAINTANSVVAASTWADEKKKRYADADNFDEQANQDVIPVDLASYEMSRPLHLPMLERRRRRTDPALLAPYELEVKSGYGAVAIKAPAGATGISATLERSSPDTRPIPESMVQSSGERGSFASGSGRYEGRFFVVITGLVPYKAQFAAYEAAFKDAVGYNIERDIPNYGGLQVERAEVGPNGQPGPWVTIDTEAGLFKEPAKWESRTEEMADRAYLLNGANLTMALPPLFRRSVDQFATHSKVPIVVGGEGGAYESRGEGGRSEGGRSEGRRGEGEPSAVEGAGDATGFFSGSNGGERRGERGTTEGDAEVTSEQARPLIENDFALLRYFDFTVEPGKTYKYRVRTMLEDPNNPLEGVRPPNSSLETEVVVRRNQATEQFRVSEWSEASPAISVSQGGQVLAGVVAQPRTVAVRDGRVRVESKASDEPTAQVLALTWKPDGPYDVPIETTVRRGAVLNGKKAEAEAIDPTVNKLRKFDYTYATDMLIADIAGGQPLDAKGLTGPGFLLVMGSDGRLEFRSETQDETLLQRNVVPPPEELEGREGTGEERMEGEEGDRRGEGTGRPRRPGARPRRGGGRNGENGGRNGENGGREGAEER
jgi:hypothetical protein